MLVVLILILKVEGGREERSGQKSRMQGGAEQKVVRRDVFAGKK